MNHMNSKAVIGLGAAALVAIGAAVVITQRQKPVSEATLPTAAAYALPSLRDHVNEVSSITLTGANDKVLATIEKSTDGWRVKEKNYSADTAKVRELLLKLADATLVEQKTANEKRYAELGVEDVKMSDAKGALVTLGGLAQPQQLIVGNANNRGEGTFVRRAVEAQSWLAKGNLTIDKNPANWLDKSIVDIPATRLKEVSLTQTDGRRLKLTKMLPSDANFAVADVPKGRELSGEFATNGIASMLSGLHFDDVFAASEAASPVDGKTIKGRYIAFDGTAVDVEGWKQGDKTYARFAVSFDRAAAEASIIADQARAKAEWDAQRSQKPAETKPVEGQAAEPAAMPVSPPAIADPARDREQRLAALDQSVAVLRARVGSRVFVLPAYKFENLEKTTEDVLKPVEAKKPVTKDK